jgi:hypothetical protein
VSEGDGEEGPLYAGIGMVHLAHALGSEHGGVAEPLVTAFGDRTPRQSPSWLEPGSSSRGRWPRGTNIVSGNVEGCRSLSRGAAERPSRRRLVWPQESDSPPAEEPPGPGLRRSSQHYRGKRVRAEVQARERHRCSLSQTPFCPTSADALHLYVVSKSETNGKLQLGLM